jgi:hypothetical protein
VVKVVAAEVGVARCRFYFNNTVGDFQDRYVKSTATEVKYQDGFVFVFSFETISQSCGSRLVDDSQYIQTSNCASVFGGLTLRVVKVGRDCDYSSW